MSQKKYLRLSGFNKEKASLLPERNDYILKKLEDLCIETYRHLNPKTVSDFNLKNFYDFLNELNHTKEKQPYNYVEHKDFIRAIKRIRSLTQKLLDQKCILGRNVFLDTLNLKQIVWYVTNEGTIGTKLGEMARSFSTNKKF